MAFLSSAARRVRVAAVAATVVVIGGACASGKANPAEGSSNVAPAGTPKHDRSTITSDDMKSLELSNLYDVVQRLHPEWLVQRSNPTMSNSGGRTRGAATSSDPSIQVYMDMQHAGNIDMLKQMPVNSADALKFYSPSEAEAKFGTGNSNSVIQVLPSKK